MKHSTQLQSLFVSLSAAAFAAGGIYASGQAFDAGVVSSIFLAAGLAGWTFQQYARAPRPLVAFAAVVRLPVRPECPAEAACPALPQAA